ncbi:hypothetical protein GCK72_003337 [Caenorhabditis remanei]|uniref:BRO1 domain-containing protein n=1 Tax=Caenorhabditis remanei TaxID=31234 RepID=A0A6A5HTG6_CAERE|nr:hypothetical protein GCK72_003337 [Caenorhabditis remanei]KAF1771510.1 hypothetical protein GCK72_003337 [Caenorhabditis remanei]
MYGSGTQKSNGPEGKIFPATTFGPGPNDKRCPNCGTNPDINRKVTYGGDCDKRPMEKPTSDRQNQAKMEALPTMPLMAPQFRTSTLSYDNIPSFDFRLRMKEYILLTFNADPHDYDKAFDELSQLKFEANIPAATPEQTHKLKKYYNQLCLMQKRFPMGSGEQMETPFAWHDGLVDMRSAQSEVTICDIEFEKASVMFNIGTCHAQIAAEQLRDTQESIKTAFSHLQAATLAFEQLNTFRNSDFFYPSVDLDANVIAFYYKVLLAQAQECLVQKSLLENRSPILIAKLCLWIQEAYDSATKIVDDWSVNIPESVQRYYAKLCRVKSDIYAVIGYMSMGDHSEKEEKKMGWRLQYYNIAMKYQDHLTTNQAKMRDRYPELYVTSLFLFDVITAKQKNAEKENDFIYHDRVPKQEDAVDAALKDGVRCIVDLKKVQLMDPSGAYGADLFAKLLPSFVQEATAKYSEKKDEILREMKEIIKSYDDHLNYQLQLAEFDKLRFMLDSGRNREAWFEISEDLMRRNADMTSYPDCVPNLIEKMRESSDTARVAEAKLNTLLSKLRAIDLPRLKADEGFNLIQKELERLGGHLEQAKANNVSLNKAIAQHSANLQLLTLPCAEMWQKIVPQEAEGVKKSSSEVPSEQERRMREMVNKVLEMIEQRKQFIAQLEATLKADDISSKLIGTNERGAEEIMHKELEKHSDAQKLIRLNATAQDAILRAFTDANADFFEERSELSTKKEEYERRVVELCASYEVFQDVQRKCEEGEQFYRQLMARCDQFAIPVHAMEEQYREELEKKERAQKEAEHHMNQLRMSREAQSALMDFGGGGGASRPPPGGGAYPPPPRGGASGPRLGDFLDSYRARKAGNQMPPSESQEVGGAYSQAPPPGPPSPTPSSICDFPVSSRSQRFASHAPFQAPPPGSPAYQQPYPGPPPSSYSVPRVVPEVGGAYGQQAPPTPRAPGGPGGYQAPPNSQQAPPPPGYQYQAPPTSYQAPPTGYSPSPVPSQGSYQAPPTQHQAPPTGYAPSPVPIQGSYQAPPTSQQAPPPGHQYQAPPTYQAPPPASYAPSPAPSHAGSQGSYQAPPTQGYQYQAPLPALQQAPPPPRPPVYGGPAHQYQAPPPSGAPGGYQAPPTSSVSPNHPGFHSYQAPPTQQAPPPTQQYQAPPTSQQAPPPPPQYPSYQSIPPPAQPTYQHPPLGAPISAPPPSAQHQHVVAPPTSVAPGAPAAAPNRFTPIPGAPSPWHATPAELKTPWATQPQYHAPQQTPGAQGAAPQAPPSSKQSNVDLLSDLLGDFNMAPPIQPMVQNNQYQQQAPPPHQAPPTQQAPPLQQQNPSDFRLATNPPEPPSVASRIKPAAAVQPMPQQQQQSTGIVELRQLAQQHVDNVQETPILMKGSPSVTELSDPSKFQLGEGNVQKLEKRMLHQSFRTNGPPPPLNQSDPLNQIDAFSFASFGSSSNTNSTRR